VGGEAAQQRRAGEMRFRRVFERIRSDVDNRSSRWLLPSMMRTHVRLHAPEFWG
jgi:hypothetical protein